MTAPRSRLLVALAGGLALVVGLAIAAGARPAERSAPTRDTNIVKGMSRSWSPSTVRIATGDVVKWKAVVGTHTVTAYGGAWHLNESLNPGIPVTRRFAKAGTYKFRCTFHSTLSGATCSGMCGKVTVTA